MHNHFIFIAEQHVSGSTECITRPYGDFDLIKHESNKPHLVRDTALLSPQWSAKYQESGESKLTGHVFSTRFVGSSHERSKHLP